MLGIDPLTAGALLTLAASGSSFCQMPKAAEINVAPRAKAIKYDYSKTLLELQAQETDTINPYGFDGTSHTQGFMMGRITLLPTVKLDYKHFPHHDAVCLWYDSINIEFELEPTIVIAKEVYEDRCMRKAVVDHEKKHVAADRKIINKYANEMGRKVFAGLEQRGFKAGPVKSEDAQAVADRMQKTVQQIIEHEYKKMEIDRAEAQQAIDSLEEYESVSARCPDFGKASAALRRR